MGGLGRLFEGLEHEQGHDLRRGVVQEFHVSALEIPEKVLDASVVEELAEGIRGFVELETSV